MRSSGLDVQTQSRLKVIVQRSSFGCKAVVPEHLLEKQASTQKQARE
jgi:hypothetical protein